MRAPRTTMPLDAEAVRAAYRAGHSLRDLAVEHGCSHVHIQRLLYTLGEPLRAPCRTTTVVTLTPEQRTELRNKAVVLLHQAGMSAADIAGAFGHKKKWALLILRENGIAVSNPEPTGSDHVSG